MRDERVTITGTYGFVCQGKIVALQFLGAVCVAWSVDLAECSPEI